MSTRPQFTANDTTEDRVATLHSLLNDASIRIGQKRLRIADLEELLQRCADFIEPYADVSDGAYGEPVPNAAMRLLSAINEELS